MEALLSSLGIVGTSVLNYVGDVATLIVDTPLMLFTVGFLFIGGVISIFGKILRNS